MKHDREITESRSASLARHFRNRRIEAKAAADNAEFWPLRKSYEDRVERYTKRITKLEADL